MSNKLITQCFLKKIETKKKSISLKVTYIPLQNEKAVVLVKHDAGAEGILNNKQSHSIK